MQFAIIATDKLSSESIRDSLRATRLKWLTANKYRIIAGGGLVDDRNKHVSGGLMIVDAKDRAEAETFAAEDPFNDANLYEDVRVVRWRKVFLNYERITTPDPFMAD